MSLRVSVKNVGPINEASVEVKPLTVFIGTNNTGKTFFATIVHKVVESATLIGLGFRSRRRWSPEVPEEIAALVSGRRRTAKQHTLFEPTGDFATETVAWAHQYLTEALTEYATAVKASIEYAFGVEAGELRRRTVSGRKSHGSWVEVASSTGNWRVRVHLDGEAHDIEIPDPVMWLRTILKNQGPSGEDRDADLYERLVGYLPTPTPGLFDDWPRQSIHLPAGRTGIMQSYQVLAGTVVRQSAAAGIRPIQVATLPGTAADFLSLLLSLAGGSAPPLRRRRPPHRSITDLVDELETTNRLQIVVDDTPGEVMSSVYAVTPEGRFPLARTSSMVSEMAPILLALRHLVSSGDQLVIDEPEAHLHPAMQRTIAGFFARLSSSDVRLVITTHSDFLVGELNNLIRASGVGRPAGSQGVLALGTPVSSDSVTALRFERRTGGCYSVELPVDPFDGIDESTFADVMEALYDEAIELSDLKTRND